jgi:uncharacterized protein Usg
MRVLPGGCSATENRGSVKMRRGKRNAAFVKSRQGAKARTTYDSGIRERLFPSVWGEAVMTKFELALRGYSLTTAEILYRMPDHPDVLQSFIWQEFDLVPQFPVLNKFLTFWTHNIEGRLHSVRVAARGLIQPSELKMVGSEFTLH